MKPASAPRPVTEMKVPPAVIEQARRMRLELSADKNSLAILELLISDCSMRQVWGEIYKKKRTEKYLRTDEYFYPARVTNASWAAIHRQRAAELRKKGGPRNEEEAANLDAEAAIEENTPENFSSPASSQDLAAQRFLHHACHAAIDIKPVFLTSIRAKIAKIDDAAKSLRHQAKNLRSLGLKSEARRLVTIAEDCDDEARNLQPGDDPWIIARDRGGQARVHSRKATGDLRNYDLSSSSLETLLEKEKMSD